VLANVRGRRDACWRKKTPLLYRIHEETLALASWNALRETGAGGGYTFGQGAGAASRAI